MSALTRFVFAFFLFVAASAAWSQSPNPPIGNAESAGASGGSYVTVGWACDPDDYGAVLAIHFYLDGTYDTGTFVGAVGAYDYRGDLYGVCGGTAYHGYNFTIPSQYLPPGQHTIYAYALDNGGAGPNPLLGALSFNVNAQTAPFGWLEIIEQSGNTMVASGWTCDSDDLGMALQVQFYADWSQTYLGSTTANIVRYDVAEMCGNTVAHGFNFTLPSMTPGAHNLYVYAIDNSGASPNALLQGSPMGFSYPQPPRTDLLYGYYYGCANYAGEQAGHMNLWWARGCDGASSGVWHTDIANELQAARAAGATSVALHLWENYMTFGSNAQANATNEFQALAATGQLSGFSSIMIYPMDEPDMNGINDATMTSAVQMLRSVIAGIPQLAQAKFGVIYNCNTAGAPGFGQFDWIGCDDYETGCNALDKLTANFPISGGQRYMVVPGGASPWQQDPYCFMSFAQSHSEVVAVVPFLWQTEPGLPGIRDNGMRSTYCQAGRTVTGQPGAC